VKKNIYIIAGPNGSGKTTFAREFLPDYAQCPHFINSDLIAQGLSPFYPQRAAIKAGKLVLREIKEMAHKGADFGFETTLSGRTYEKYFQSFKEKGYRLHIFFLWIPGDQLAIARIKNRVAEGGHDVPEEDIRRRFQRSMANFFHIYSKLANCWMLLDNSGVKPLLIARKNDQEMDIVDEDLFRKIKGKRV
jgi:predicted ABC-type ATPase